MTRHESTITGNRASLAELQEEEIALLSAELSATVDRSKQAVLQYEIGDLYRSQSRDAEAVREYLGAYNLDPTFRPPLIALVSIFERRLSTKNLTRLYDAETRSAVNPREAASALAARATLLSQDSGDLEDARALLDIAREQAPEAEDIALLLEYHLLRLGQANGAAQVIADRAELVRDPVLSSLLRLEVARDLDRGGDTDGAIEMLREALTFPAARFRVLARLERLARREGRFEELAVAVEGRAKLAQAQARGQDQGQASGAFSLHRFADSERQSAEAAALFSQAGHLRHAHLGDPRGAISCYEEAIALCPEQPFLQYQRMMACEAAGDFAGAATTATALLSGQVSGPYAAALHFRLAENQQNESNPERALEHLRAAWAEDPTSPALAATLDDLLRTSGELEGAVDLLESRAAVAEGQPQAQRYFEAAQLAAELNNDISRALPLYRLAVSTAADPIPILREAYGQAMRLGDPEGVRWAAEALLEHPLEPDERAVTLRDLHELLRVVIEDHDAADALLEEALEDPAAAGWVPDLARFSAAVRNVPALLAKAHLVLAARSADAATSAAHLCAAARAQIRAQLSEDAEATLRRALDEAPGHPYAMALLEQLLRSVGNTDAVVELLRADDAEVADPEMELLLAGAAAEAAGNDSLAVERYQEAVDLAPDSLSARLCLLRLALAAGDPARHLHCLEQLSALEIRSEKPGAYTLALGELYDLQEGNAEQAASTLIRALDSESESIYAAADLAALGIDAEPESRLTGLRLLADQAEGRSRQALLRELVGTALSRQSTADDATEAKAFLQELREDGQSDRWSQLATLRLLAREPVASRARADVWVALGQITDDPEVAADLMLHGLRAMMVADGSDGADDAVILAHEIADGAPRTLSAAVALSETLSPGDDPESQASALSDFLDQGSKEGSAASIMGMQLAQGRALAAGGRPKEALEVLFQVAVADPDDLASWEAIRGCARSAGVWAAVVEACDRMAHILSEGDLSCMLLEESAAVLMDELHEDARAERRLRQILAMDPSRILAYGRLHDLLAERDDEGGLLELVSARIDLIDAPDELVKLFYEQARLLRSLGLRDDASGALDNLLFLDGDHLGGLALLVEIRVAEENWEGSIEALRMLASADEVPDSQRRIARLGAADFLESKMGDSAGALRELQELEMLGQADEAIYTRMVAIFRNLSDLEGAIRLLDRAVRSAGAPEEQPTLSRLMAKVQEERGETEAAIEAFGWALQGQPLDLESAAGLIRLQGPEHKGAICEGLENELRAQLLDEPGDPALLEGLRQVARWTEDTSTEELCRLALEGIGELDFEPCAPVEPKPGATLTNADFRLLGKDAGVGPVLRLAQSLAESTAEMHALEPAKWGFTAGNRLEGDDPTLQVFATWGDALGLPHADLLRGGDDPDQVDVLPYYRKKLTWLVGADVSAPLSSEHLFSMGRQLLALRLGVVPFVRLSPQHAATLIFASAAAVDAPLSAGEGRPGLAEATRRMAKTLSPKHRESIPQATAVLEGGEGVDEWVHEIRQMTCRFGALIGHDLRAALRWTLGSEPSREAIGESAEAQALLRFWMSEEASLLRKKLGLSK